MAAVFERITEDYTRITMDAPDGTKVIRYVGNDDILVAFNYLESKSVKDPVTGQILVPVI